MGETSSLAELAIEDIQNQLNESEKLQLTSNTQPPRFLLGLKSSEANINEPFDFTVKGSYIVYYAVYGHCNAKKKKKFK